MANQEHVDRLLGGVQEWNAWRAANPEVEPELAGVDLAAADLRGAGLSGATLREAILWKADLYKADLRGADLSRANLRKANLFEAELEGATIRNANLTGAQLVDTFMKDATIEDCYVYGCAVWPRDLSSARQRNLFVQDAIGRDWRWKDPEPPVLSVDNLEAAQLLSIFRDNQRLGSVIDAVVRKVVLILGSFSKDRKSVLDAMRKRIADLGWAPVVFDFAGPRGRNLSETVATLAHMSRFVIADVTDAKSVPQELERIVPGLPSVPVQPIVAEGSNPWAMFPDLRDYPWVLEPYPYRSPELLLASLDAAVVQPALEAAERVEARRERRVAVMDELVFEVTQEADGGFVAECLTEAIFTQADTWERLRSNVREEVAAFWDDSDRPATIRLHLVRDEVLAAG